MTRKILVLMVVAMFAVVGCKKKDDDKKGKKKPTKNKVVKKDPVKKDPVKKKDPVSKPAPKPEVVLVVIHKVKDFGKWMKAFHAHQPKRVEAGVVGHFVTRGAKNENTVAVFLPGMSKEKLEAMTKSPELKDAMKKATVEGKPQFQWLTPVDNKMSKTKKKLAGMLVTHKVADFDKWKKAYDAFDATRKKHKILGHAVARGVKDPNTVYVYHQAEEVETLKAFTKLKELGAAMKAAGVTGKPSFMYLKGEHSANYPPKGDMKKGDHKDHKGHK